MVLAVREHFKWTRVLDVLHREPGIVVTSAEKGGGKYIFTGLRDPLARDPNALLEKAGINPGDVQGNWRPYQALDPEFILTRARRTLAPPKGVSLHLENQDLVATGRASDAWLQEARVLARGIAGVQRFEYRSLREADADGEIEKLARLIESRTLSFGLESDEFTPGQEEVVGGVAKDLQALLQLAQKTKTNLSVEIVGHTETSGPEALNRDLTQKRAEAVRALLVAWGVDPGILMAAIAPESSTSPEGEAVGAAGDTGRKVIFQVRMSKAADQEAGTP
jgi:OOP family OmpA-OmpF porin